jgi:hypothetical protein
VDAMSFRFSDMTSFVAAATAEAASFCARTANSILIILDTILVSIFVALLSLLVLPTPLIRPNRVLST